MVTGSMAFASGAKTPENDKATIITTNNFFTGYRIVSNSAFFLLFRSLMSSFVPFLVYFMLSWRDHLYRGFLRLFHEHERLAAGRSMQGIASMVRAFVAGNFLLGLLLAAIAFQFLINAIHDISLTVGK